MAFMIAENIQGRIAIRKWRLAFFVFGPPRATCLTGLHSEIFCLCLLTQSVQLLLSGM